MKNWATKCCLLAACSLFPTGPRAYGQTYTDLFDLTQSTGSAPQTPDLLAQGFDGNLYSTMPTSWPDDGTVVMSPPAAQGVRVIHRFNGTDGFGPYSGLTLGYDGSFFGTTFTHTTAGFGEVFQVTAGGLPTTLYNFKNTNDGGSCWAPPIQASDGNLYGVTQGTNPVAYRIALPSGTFSVLASLPGKSVAPLIEGRDGNFYGTTNQGGTSNKGTVFQLTPAGVLTTIYSFASSNDGNTPTGGVIQGIDGYLYGTTHWGGLTTTNTLGTVYRVSTGGGSYKILHSFNSTDGSYPDTGLVQGSDNYLYGVTTSGGASGKGVFFKINPQGTVFGVLHHFDGKTSGGVPYSTPFLHTSGIIFGWASVGPREGVLYSMNVGMKPLAALVAVVSGKVGRRVCLIGQGFNSATGIEFGTGPGTFKALSDTFMMAWPSAGANTGRVTVFTPRGSLMTMKQFRVIPQITGFSPAAGPVGTSVVITGMSLRQMGINQSTSLYFGGVAATFHMNSDTQITATVPAGGLTGPISITNAGGTATSAASFTVQ